MRVKNKNSLVFLSLALSLRILLSLLSFKPNQFENTDFPEK